MAAPSANPGSLAAGYQPVVKMQNKVGGAAGPPSCRHAAPRDPHVVPLFRAPRECGKALLHCGIRRAGCAAEGGAGGVGRRGRQPQGQQAEQAQHPVDGVRAKAQALRAHHARPRCGAHPGARARASHTRQRPARPARTARRQGGAPRNALARLPTAEAEQTRKASTPHAAKPVHRPFADAQRAAPRRAAALDSPPSPTSSVTSRGSRSASPSRRGSGSQATPAHARAANMKVSLAMQVCFGICFCMVL